MKLTVIGGGSVRAPRIIPSLIRRLEETLTIEASGGLMVSNGERRRTLGGDFFYLVKGRLPKELRQQLFPYGPNKPKKPSQQPAVPEHVVQDAVAEPISENVRRLEELRNTEKEAQKRLALYDE